MEKKHAVIVGINDYEPPISMLSYCARDAEELAAALAMPEYQFEVSLLVDSEAGRIAIKRQLRALAQTPADLRLFYFAGHGQVQPDGAYLVSADGNEDEPGVDLSYVTRLLGREEGGGPSVVILVL